MYAFFMTGIAVTLLIVSSILSSAARRHSAEEPEEPEQTALQIAVPMDTEDRYVVVVQVGGDILCVEETTHVFLDPVDTPDSGLRYISFTNPEGKRFQFVVNKDAFLISVRPLEGLEEDIEDGTS